MAEQNGTTTGTTGTMAEATEAEQAARNGELLRQGYAAFAAGNLASVEALFRPDAVWHARRLGVLGGDHVGWEAIVRFFGGTMELSGATFRTEPHQVYAGPDGGAVLTRSTARREGRSLDDEQVHVFRMVDGRVAEVWQYVGDGPAVEAFWS